MKYVITGASGHIGNNLVRYIEKEDSDSEIITLSRRIIGKELKGTSAVQKAGDLFSADFLGENIDGQSIVIHCAGFIDLTNRKREETYRINYDMTKAISDICLRKKVKKFIYVGSVDGLEKQGNGVIAEPSDFSPDGILGHYGKSKALAMKYVKELRDRNKDFRACIVMPSAVLGINDYKPSAVGKVIIRALKGKAEIGIEGGYNFVDVEEVCKGIYNLSVKDGVGDYIFSGTDVSVREVYEKINGIKNIKKRPLILSVKIAKAVSPFVPVLNKITIKSLTEAHNYSSDKAIAELNYNIRNIDETFRNTVNWFETNTDI